METLGTAKLTLYWFWLIQRQLSGSFRNKAMYHKIEAELAKMVL